MLVIDTSAIIAILFHEPERGDFIRAIGEADHPVMSAASALECVLVSRSRLGPGAVAELFEFVTKSGIELVAFDSAQLATAITGFERFGKGIHPKARLNMGDCAAYALAKNLNAPLLFKGTDFPHTDIEPHPASVALT